MSYGLIIVSPHLDDAVFSCGSLIACARILMPVIVITVCAGVPDDPDGAALVQERRIEDAKALALLGADALQLDVLDDFYARGADRDARLAEIRAELALRLPSNATVAGPWGIRHPDHVLVAEALTGACDLLYEELPYRVLWSEYLPHDLQPPALELPTTALKQAAVVCYASQLGGPPGEALFAAERYHRTAASRAAGVRAATSRVSGGKPVSFEDDLRS